jgi:tetratricopeptide (TPR) repeat protein
MSVKEDPIKLHKQAMALMENKQYPEARDLFAKVAELYHKGQNYFGAAEMSYKAGECCYALKEFQKGLEYFTKSADISFAKGFERYGLTALQEELTGQKALGNTKEADEIQKKIDEINKKNAEPEAESSFSVFS